MTDKPKFDDCLEILDVNKPEDTSGDLSAFLDEETELPQTDGWKEHWQGMPDFHQEEKKPYKKLNVCFQTKEDFDAFRKLLGQTMTEKTKTIWYPPYDREKNSLFSWVEIDDE